MSIDRYYILKRGSSPSNQDVAAANLGGTCAAWAQSPDKDKTEVVMVSGATGVISRLTPQEAEKIARDFLNPKIR
jgi:hypothetical protein